MEQNKEIDHRKRNGIKAAMLGVGASALALSQIHRTAAETIITTNDIETDAVKAPTGRSATIVVAASDSSAAAKEQADYVCDGVADNVELQAALDALPAGGGEVHLCEGNYTLAATVSRAIDGVTISGNGYGTYLAYDASTRVISTGTQSNWVIRGLRVDNGWIELGTKWSISDVWKNTFHVDSWSYDTMSAGSCGGFIGEAHRHPLMNTLDEFDEGWSVSSTYGSISYDSDIVFSGATSMKIVTGAGSLVNIDKAGTFPDFTNCAFGLWVYITDYSAIDTISLYFRTTDETWNIAAYEYVPYVQKIDSQWHFISFARLSSSLGSPDVTDVNMVRVKITLTTPGSNETLYVDKLCYWKNALTPNGAVTISFDDGYESVHDLAKPHFDKHGFHGVSSLIAATATDAKIAKAHALQLDGWDVAVHTIDHDLDECYADPEFQYLYAQKWMREHGFDPGNRYALLAYGANSAAMMDHVQNNFYFARSVIENETGQTSLPGIPTLLYIEMSMAVKSITDIKGWIDDAVARKTWVNIVFHDIVESGATDFATLDSVISEAIDYCNTVGIEVLTYSQIVDRIRSTAQNMTLSGTGSIPNGSTSVNIRHGFHKEPTSIQITPTSSLGSAASLWVSSKDTTGTGNLFTVSCNADPGSDVTFEWVATL